MLGQLLTAVALSAALYGYLGWRHRKDARTPLGFFQAGRNMGSTVLSGTYIATSLALANAIFYFLWLGYTAGLMAIWIQVAWCAGFVVLYLLLPKIMIESGTKTLHEFIRSRFGSAVALLAAIISCLGIGLNFGYEVVVGSTLSMSVWAESPHAVLGFAAVITVIVVVYSWLGGFAAVLRTDAFQWVVSSLALLLAVVMVRLDIASAMPLAEFHKAHSSHFDLFSHEGLAAMGGGVLLISFVVMSLPWQFCDMTSWQKLSACDPERQSGLRVGVAFSGVYILFIPGFITLMLGIYLRHYADAETSLLGALLSATSSNPLIGGFIVFGFLAALISTADTYLIGSVQALVLDVLQRRRVPENESDSQGIRIQSSAVRLAKWMLPTLGVAFLLWTWCYWSWTDYDSDALFTMVLVVYSMQLSLVWVMLVGLLGFKRLASPAAGVCSLLCGVCANVVIITLAVTGRWQAGIAALGVINASASLVGFLAGRVVFGANDEVTAV